ncbi:type 1 glycerol-3-phosphate oxidase [Ligilactobacillus ceti]|uniref:Alpha-glycerophosphate oxidase n=1 Tax=Ligilactobacillus ceti DSM 22408 TaxID=1122146 RepID=A0A0R2KGB7_9LACO|nr:type 1 glycerol-3-phosphate oxidase [Ligilactobacillus ceti]KRN88398.1 glycerol-3-phosphate dehydrogenase [Ligilactobacillus ceti DSM 22408]
MDFSYQTRNQIITKLKETELDLLVIGGGITGAGVALQAVASDLQTGLIEMQDFAEGTSSRSTKLVHGGIRYLKNFDVGVVADTVQERAIVQKIAPHIPKPAPMLLPIYADPTATYDMFSVKIAMDLYDRLAGITGTQYANYTITRDEVLQREPELTSENLLGGGVYLDFVNNDARLVIENIKEAAERGGLMASRVKAIGMLHDEAGVINGVRALDTVTKEEFTIKAKVVINTTGHWAERVTELDQLNGPGQSLRPTKGVHLIIDESRLNVPQPTYFDSGLGDGRMIFVVPREGKTYFGTTDTDYTGDYAHPKVEQNDVDYLLTALNQRYPNINLTINDIEGSWAGIRPLIASNGSSDYNGGTANTGKVSPDSFNNLIDVVMAYQNQTATRSDVEKAISKLQSSNSEQTLNPSQVSRGSSLDLGQDGLITLTGGKITDYRKMAAGALTLIRDVLQERFGMAVAEIDSTSLQVSGGHFDPTNVDETIKFYQKIAIDKGIPDHEAFELANLYGSNLGRVVYYLNDVQAAEGLTLAETISLHYAIFEEMVLNPVDFFLRRTNKLLFHSEQLIAKKEAYLAAMSQIMNWDDAQVVYNTNLLNEALAESRLDYLK